MLDISDILPRTDIMIAKSFFLMKIIRRIRTRNLRGEKSLHESGGEMPDLTA